MSGGTFHFVQDKIDNAVEKIESTLALNNVTVQQHWDSLSDEQRKRVSNYNRPWNAGNVPAWVNEVAERAANNAMGVGDYIVLKDDELAKWNRIRKERFSREIQRHNDELIGSNYSQETVNTIKDMLRTIKTAAIYLRRIDWLFEGDDGEEEFHTRTKEDLKDAGLLD